MTVKVEMSESLITTAALEDWKKRVGADLRIPNIFNQNASYEAIRNFANGIGDNNPLYRDSEYGKKTRYKRLVASPGWYHSVAPWVLQGLPGVHGFHAGSKWIFYKPVFEGDYVTPKCTFLGFDIRASKFAKKSGMEYQRLTYTNQKQELLAKVELWEVRSERGTARKEGKYSSLTLPHPWTKEELEKVDEEVLNEQIRGSEIRFWEDIEIGEKLPTLVKGPIGLTDIIAYCIGAAPVTISAHGTQLKLYKDHPAWAFRDPLTYAWEPVYGVHYNKEAANVAGVPYPYDVGVQRQSWSIKYMTNWIGDEGWLKENYGEYRRFVYLSDVLRFNGVVTKKYTDDNGECCVDVETSVISQRGENVMPGHSTAVFPSKKKKDFPVAKRL